MTNKFTINTWLYISVAIAIVVFSGTPTVGQTFRIQNQGKTGHGFTTTEGNLTALHVGGLPFDYLYPAMDIGINTRNKSAKGFQVSELPPAYFIDRRGTRHRVVELGPTGLQTSVSLRFYPGESGMPVFAEDGTVCCVVLGNHFDAGRWHGRVSKIQPLLDAISKAKIK